MAFSNSIKYPSTRATINFMNADSDLQKSKLYIEYWNGMIKLGIAPMVEGTNTKGQFPQFDTKAGVTAYIMQAKAHVLMNEITKFIKDPSQYSNAGVRSGDNLILIERPENYPQAKNFVLTIIKMEPKTNNIKDMFHYEFKAHYHCGVRNYDMASSKFDLAYDYDTLEISELITTLKSYIEASTSAYAAELLTKDTFDRNRFNEKLNAIAKNLGVDISYNKPAQSQPSYSNSSGYNSKSSYPQYQSPSNRYVMEPDDDIPF